MTEEKKSEAQNEPQVLYGEEANVFNDSQLRELMQGVLVRDTPGEQLPHVIDQKLEQIHQSQGENRMTILQVLKEPVAATRLKKWGEFQGRPIYELKGVVTHKDHTGHHYSDLVVERAIEAAVAEDERAIVMLITEGDSMKSALERQKLWEEMPEKEYRAIQKALPHQPIFSKDFLNHGNPNVRVVKYDDVANGGAIAKRLREFKK